MLNEERDRVFSALVERHGRSLYQLAYRLTGHEQDAKDVVQESFYRAFRGLDRFEGRADAATWLHRIVVNCAMDLLRAARTRPDRRYTVPLSEVSGIAATPSPNPERLAASTEVGVRIAAALEELKPVERAAFMLRHFEECAIDDIARTLGIRSNAAKQHVFRAIRKLRAALDEQRG